MTTQRTASPGLGSLGSGAVTAAALGVQTGMAAIVGVIIAREFGRSAETDGFFAAYGVFIVLALTANAIRLVVLPALTRAREERRLAQETSAWAVSLGVVVLPLLVASVVVAGGVASLLTGSGSGVAQATAADALPLLVLAGVCQIYAGIAASALAALDDYVTSALAYVAGAALGLTAILIRVDVAGIDAIATGIALNAVVALGVQLAVLAARARRAAMPATGLRPHRSSIGERIRRAARGVTLPLALQATYLICLPLAAREGTGAVTSFGYAYLAGAAIVAVTAASFGLVTSAPLTRLGLDASRVAHHVVATSWLALLAVGAVAGVFAVAGEPVFSTVLGSSYVETVGSEIGHLVAVSSPWMVVTIGVTVTLPLVFVMRRDGALVTLSLVVIAVHVPLAFLGQALAGLTGLMLALAASATVALAGMLRQLGAARATVPGLVHATGLVAALAAIPFVAAGLALAPIVAAVAGLAMYSTAIMILRPRGLVESLRYLRSLA